MTDAHLDDEQLSLLLDGLAPEGRDHVGNGGCAPCSDRLAALRRAREAVAAAGVPTLPPATLDMLVATALDATAPADVVPITASRRRVATPPPAWLIGAAAGVAALVGVTGLLRATDLGSDDRGASMASTAANDEFSGADTGAAALESAAGGSATGGKVLDPEVVSVDLADQDDPAALALTLGNLAMVTGTPMAAATADAASPSAGGAGSTSGGSAVPQAERGAAPPASTVPVDRAQCRTRAEEEGAGRLAELLSTATLRWKGQPAEVLVFRLAEPSADGSITRQALVFSRPGCSLLADPRF